MNSSSLIESDGIEMVLAAVRKLEPSAVGSQMLLMFSLSLITLLFFNILRPNNKLVYQPKIKYHVGHNEPPCISDACCGWVLPTFRTTEFEMLDRVGLDAVTFLRFIRMMRWIFTLIAFTACGALIPVNYLYTTKNYPPASYDLLSVLTIRDVKGFWLCVHIGVMYLITLFVLVLVYINWREMVKLKKRWYRSPEYAQSFYARTISITQVKKRMRSDEGIGIMLDSLAIPYSPTSVHIGRKIGKLQSLINFHNQNVAELERFLVNYLKGGKISKKRPTIRLGGCGCVRGVNRDAIKYYTAEIKRSEEAVHAYRAHIDTRQPEDFGFASFATIPYAHIIAKRLVKHRPGGTRITLAPNPKDIIWENFGKSMTERAARLVLAFLLLSLICCASLIPLFPVATLANLDVITATGHFEFLQNLAINSSFTYSLVSGILPPTASIICFFLLPRIIRWVSRLTGARTYAHLDRAVIARYFVFLVISQLFIFTLIGVLYNPLLEIIAAIKTNNFSIIMDNVQKLPHIIASTYVKQSAYWLKWLPTQGFIIIYDLLRLQSVVYLPLKTRLFGRTPRDIRNWTKPSEFEYCVNYSNLLHILVICWHCGICFCSACTAYIYGRRCGVLDWLVGLQVPTSLWIDPAQYRRDCGLLDWEAEFLSSSGLLYNQCNVPTLSMNQEPSYGSDFTYGSSTLPGYYDPHAFDQPLMLKQNQPPTSYFARQASASGQISPLPLYQFTPRAINEWGGIQETPRNQFYSYPPAQLSPPLLPPHHQRQTTYHPPGSHTSQHQGQNHFRYTSFP